VIDDNGWRTSTVDGGGILPFSPLKDVILLDLEHRKLSASSLSALLAAWLHFPDEQRLAGGEPLSSSTILGLFIIFSFRGKCELAFERLKLS